ncbi:hypothetical protein [Sulfurospirillum tamanense]|nr:hypothetical protein [Sulfurospirillum tamanensis]
MREIVDVIAWGAFAFFVVFLVRGFNRQMQARHDERERRKKEK